MRNLLLIAAAVASQAVIAAGEIYSWMDESGHVMYGDTPPDHVVAAPVNPPKLTVLEGFSTRYQQNASTNEQPVKSAKERTNRPTDVYSELKVIAPKQGQDIRANDGDVSVALGLSPKLQSGDRIVITLDGKTVSNSTSRVANLSNLSRGEHVIDVSVVDRVGNRLITAETITFSVLRNSKLIKRSFNPYQQE